MADRSKVRWSQLKVGIVGLAAFAILAALIFLLTGSTGLFQKTAHLRTYMEDAFGIPDGATVRLNGITIGALNKLSLIQSPDPKRNVEFDMEIQARYLNQIPVDSVAGISAANLLGDKFINITKGKDQRHVQDGAEMQGLLADVRHGKGTLSKLLYEDGLYNDLQAPIKRIDAMLADLQGGQGTAGKLLRDSALFDDARQTIDQMRLLVADINAGKGTAGKLLKDDDLSKRIDELLGKLNGTIDKINSGQGALGQFLVNPQFYESLTGATREFQSLAKDMRANPKKFLSIRLTLF